MAIGHGWVSCILQHFVIAAWTDPDVAVQVGRAGRVYAERQGALREALAERGIDVWGRSGLNLWIPVSDETAAVVSLRDAGFAVAPGRSYSFHGDQGIRVSTSRLDPALAPAVADAIAAASGPAAPPV
jgi:aspartate/methionine/tyrosine aminotransferase